LIVTLQHPLMQAARGSRPAMTVSGQPHLPPKMLSQTVVKKSSSRMQ
jgi:hypothetical protein